MPDSLLDATLQFCRDALIEMSDTPARTRLEARLGTLEHSAESLTVISTDSERVLKVAKLALDLRDDVASARAADVRIPTAHALRLS